MSNVILNETPLKTTEGFNINNIKLNNVEIPRKIDKFENINIICDTNKVDISNSNTKYLVTYGVSNDLVSQAKLHANSRINLNINSHINKNIQINYIFDKNNRNLVSNIELIANEDTKSTVVIRYESNEDYEGYNNLMLKVIAKNNASINIIIINKLNYKINNFVSIDNELYDSSNVNYTIIDFGGKNSITNYYSNLIGNNSNNKINTIYLGSNEQVLDLNYIGELRGSNSNIDIKVEGALKDMSKKHFKGTIDFKKGAKKSIGNENESCMLLSDTAKSISLPMLLCTEEDVIGNHSSSAGKIGEKELFYIMSRGFTLKESLKLIVRAKFNEILKSIKDENIKDEILNEIDFRLN